MTPPRRALAVFALPDGLSPILLASADHGRFGKAVGRTPEMHAAQKSDELVVPVIMDVGIPSGVPQGATISPLLANVYLHYVLDLWVDAWHKRHARGQVTVIRYADGFVLGFEHESDAGTLWRELVKRLARFKLTLHSEKTRLIRFGRYAAQRLHERGRGKPECLSSWGFTHACARNRKGGFMLARLSSKTRMRAKLLPTPTLRTSIRCSQQTGAQPFSIPRQL